MKSSSWLVQGLKADSGSPELERVKAHLKSSEHSPEEYRDILKHYKGDEKDSALTHPDIENLIDDNPNNTPENNEELVKRIESGKVPVSTSNNFAHKLSV